MIMGSHACRTAMLLLEHKRIAYELVSLPSGLHPVAVRLAGFAGRCAPREIDGERRPLIGIADRMGTVPALLAREQRVQGNRAIARFLDELRPEPPLFPADPARRAQVEEVERWGDEVLQMAARRVILSATARGALIDGGDSGRLGPLLFRHRRARRAAARVFAFGFAAGPSSEPRLLNDARAAVQVVDQRIDEGLLNAETLSAADFMVAPSLALLSYHGELAGELAGRPAGRLLDRVLAAGDR